LLPNVSSVREAAANLLCGSYAKAVLCLPPVCNSLVNNQYDVKPQYPAIQTDVIRSADVLASGLRVGYDPGIVTMEALAYVLTDTDTDTDYAFDAVEWLDGERDFIVRQEQGGQTFKLRALIVPDSQSVTFLEPEPSSVLLLTVALSGLAIAHRRRRGNRYIRRCPPPNAGAQRSSPKKRNTGAAEVRIHSTCAPYKGRWCSGSGHLRPDGLKSFRLRAKP
jgi:hypothetical protein